MASERKRVVLIGIDDSKFAVNAFDFYAEHIMQDNDYLCLVHVPEVYDFHWASPVAVDKVLDELSVKIQALEDKFTLKMKDVKIGGKFRTGEGRPGEVICQIAHDEHAQMIVVGTRGLGTIRRTLLGSVSDYIVHHARMPVLICKFEAKS